MTAMPPTKGHRNLIQFAAELADTVEVILCTQPEEPFVQERYDALTQAFRGDTRVNIHRIHKALPQEPEDDPGFWEMWVGFLEQFGLQSSDYIVASELYGIELAKRTGATFMPYDIGREIEYTKATNVRYDLYPHFNSVLPEFQPILRQTVTIFGSESVGKSTLTQMLATHYDSVGLPEWARPYLEAVGNTITTERMTNIWHGQAALQDQAQQLRDTPFIFQDTDLFSTVGYWSMWDYESMPQGLLDDARARKSDLYIIPRCNIPFEEDPLRYGGDDRETDDEYWISLCEREGLNYVVLDHFARRERVTEATNELDRLIYKSGKRLRYERVGNS